MNSKYRFPLMDCLAILLALVIGCSVLTVAVKAPEPELEPEPVIVLSDLYPETGIVVDVIGDVVVAKTKDGNRFSFIGDGYMLGDTISMMLYSCGTPEIYDDGIVDVK